MKTLALIALLSFAPAALATETITCKPSDYTSTIFADITVQALPNAAQNLLQVSGQGIHTAVDLLCSQDKCVGFVNGLRASGTTVTEQGVLKSVHVKSFNFTCD